MERAVVVRVGETHPLIEAVAGREEHWPRTEVPLAVTRGHVSFRLKQLRQKRLVRVNAGGAGVVQRATQADAVRIASGHERGPRRRADRLRDTEAGEPGP